MRLCPRCADRFDDRVAVCPHDGEALGAPGSLVGLTIDGRYRIDARIGGGAMGAVYRATQLNLKRAVAVKVVHPDAVADAVAVERFEREALAVARLKHPAIITIHDFGVAPDVGMYIVTEFLEGRSLRDEMDARGPIPVPEALSYAETICAAVGAAHAAGVIHRDLKPDNIFLEATPEGPAVKVLDFGIAKIVDEIVGRDDVTGKGVFVGTASYAAPEQCECDALDERSDIYSIGCVLFEMLSGRPPFVADSVRTVMLQHVTRKPSAPSAYLAGIPADVDAHVLTALAKEPHLRFQSAGEFATALASCVPADAAPARTTGSFRSVKARPSTTRTVAGQTSGAAVDASGAPFVGRNEELGELVRRLDLSREGECHVVFVAGGAGLGKSRLVDELERTARARRALVLRGNLASAGGRFGLDGFREVLAAYVAERPPDVEGFGDLAGALAAVFPELGGAASPADAGSAVAPIDDVGSAVDAIAKALGRAARRVRLVLVFENLHLAGDALAPLYAVTRRLAGAPALVVGTYRPAYVDRGHPLARVVEAFRGERRFAHVELGPLAPAHVRALAESVLGGALDADLERDLYRACGGDPFFASEIAANAAATGLVGRDDPGAPWVLRTATLAAAAPESIVRAVAERVERLPDAARRALNAAAVLGTSFESDELEALADAANPAEFDGALRLLLADRFLAEESNREGNRLGFPSLALREAVYTAIPKRARRALHRRFAERLEETHAGRIDRVRARVVDHYSRAEMPERTVEHALELARGAVQIFDGDRAEAASRTALASIDPEDFVQQGQALESLASAHEILGRPADALCELYAALGAYRRARRADLAVAAIERATATAWESRLVEDAKRWLERGMATAASAGDRAGLTRIRALGAKIANSSGDNELGARLAAEAAVDTGAASAYSREPGGPSAEPSRIRTAGLWGVVEMPVDVGPRTLDPYVSGSYPADDILSNVFETLFDFDEEGALAPHVATSLAIEDEGRRYRLRLREGVRFHDGSPLTSADVRSSFVRLLSSAESPYRRVFDAILGARELVERGAGALEGVVCASDLEVAVELERPVAFFPSLLANGLLPIVPALARRFDATWSEGCVGSGPFRVARFEPGRLVELEANPDYWAAGRPRAARLRFDVGVAPEAAAAGFRAGRYAIVTGLPLAEQESLARRADSGVRVRAVASVDTASLYFNVRRGAFADESARRRVIDAVDVERAVPETLGRSAVPARSLIPPGLLGYDPEPRVRREPVAPRGGLVAVRGSAPPGFMTGRCRELRARIEEAFEDAGFRLTLEELTADSVFARSRSVDAPDVMIAFWSADFPDADTFAYHVLHTRDGNVGPLCGVPEIDALAERARSEGDPRLRRRIYREIELEVASRALLLPLFHPQRFTFAAPEIDGFELRATIPTIPYARLRVAW